MKVAAAVLLVSTIMALPVVAQGRVDTVLPEPTVAGVMYAFDDREATRLPLSLKGATLRAKQVYKQAKILSAKTVRSNAKTLHQIKLLRPGGRLKVVYIEPNTGRFLER